MKIQILTRVCLVVTATVSLTACRNLRDETSSQVYSEDPYAHSGQVTEPAGAPTQGSREGTSGVSTNFPGAPGESGGKIRATENISGAEPQSEEIIQPEPK